MIGRLTLVAMFSLLPAFAIAQPAEPDDPACRVADDPAPQAAASTSPPSDTYVPITQVQRVGWIVEGTVGPRSLAVGVLAAGLQPGFKAPRNWAWTWTGYGRRYAEREADVAISSTIEAELGGVWGEEPRYISSGRRGAWPRTRYALKTVFLAQRPGGRLAPAWGRYAGNVFNNLIENAWLPPAVTTWQQTTLRSASGFLGRAAGNLWNEFWPDVQKRFKR